MLSVNDLICIKHPAATLLFFLILSQGAECQVGILDSTFTFSAGTVKTSNALNIISRETGYKFTYDTRIINTDSKVKLSFSEIKLSRLLDSLFQNDRLVYSVIDKFIIISSKIAPVLAPADSIPEWNVRYITGHITDNETYDPLPFASVGLKNNGKGTVSNNNGEFILKITPDCINDTLYISYLGYVGREIPVLNSLGNNFTIVMKREYISIPEIIIRTQIPQEIIHKTLASISRNYGNTPSSLTGFYREGVMKKDELQSYSEAVIDIYKSAYTGSIFGDQIKIFKSRKIENSDLSDTLAIRLKAGLNTCLELDGVKNRFDFIELMSLPEYNYRMTDIVSFDEDAAFAVEFEQKDGVDQPLFKGVVYINTSDYAILQADFEINQKYIQKIKDSFISSSTNKFNTWPVSVKYSVSYRKLNGRYFLSHVRGDLLFISKQKKKLFNTQFKVFFELAITGININNVTRFEREELAPVHAIFSKTITNYDPEFWENQDFLKPEDNLLKALTNMKVRQQEFSAP
jgi:hypothetical protein